MSGASTLVTEQTQKAPLEPCQVFLIEDDYDDRILAEKELEKCQLVKDFRSFPDGAALTEYMKQAGFYDRSVLLFSPVLILVDLEMPRKDGLEVIKELKSDSFLEHIPLVVITSTKSTEKIQLAREYGACGVFRKPLTQNMIYRYLNDAWKWPPQEMWS